MGTEEESGTRGLITETDETNWGFKGKNYLFLIGIDKYEHWTPLKCAVKDIQDFADLLISRYQFEKADIIMLKDEEATENNIINKLIELAEHKITDEDNLIVYFSGHGCLKANTGYWIPVDAPKDQPGQFINTAIIADWLKNINSLHTFLIVDACFSGKLVSQLRGSAPKAEKYKSRRIFTSGRAEVVADGREGENSPFAKGMLLTLSQNTKPFIYASRFITEVKEYVEREAKQKPMDASIINADDEGGDFVFHLKISEPEVWAIVINQHTKDAYKKFADDFPNSPHAPEALDAYDWLVALETPTIKSLKKYIIEHSTGKYFGQAIEELDKAYCLKARSDNTFMGWVEYLKQFPDGKCASEAREALKKLNGPHDDETIEKEIAKERLLHPPDLVIESNSSDEDAWKKAQENNTFIDYHDFTQSFPNSSHVEEAKEKMNALDQVASNNVKFFTATPTPSLKEKIEKCINYFREFPGAPNNPVVKRIKDKLEIERFKKGE